MVAAAAVAEAKAQAKAEAETRQAAFQASEEARMRVVRRARERTNKARGRFTAYCNRAEDVGSMWETGGRTTTDTGRRGMKKGGRMTEAGDGRPGRGRFLATAAGAAAAAARAAAAATRAAAATTRAGRLLAGGRPCG